MESLHRFFNPHRLVESMDLKKVQVRRPQSAKACIDRIEDGCSAEPTLVDIVFGLGHRVRIQVVQHARLFTNWAETFRKKNDLVARNVVGSEEVPDHGL